MPLSANTRFRRGDYRRECDICSNPNYLKSQGKMVDGGTKWACPECYGGRWTSELDVANATSARGHPRTPALMAIKSRQQEIAHYAEGKILNAIALPSAAPPNRYYDVTGSGEDPFVFASELRKIHTAGWCAIYLYGLIVENKRPDNWLALARTQFDALTDFLLDRQVALSDTAMPPHGCFWETRELLEHKAGGDDPGFFYLQYSWSAEGTAVGGLAMLYAYALRSDPKWLIAARRAAWNARAIQCGGLLTYGYSVSDAPSGTARLQLGTWTHTAIANDTYSLAIDPPAYDHLYYTGDLVVLRFLNELLAVDGDATYGPASHGIGSYWNTAPAALLSDAIAQATTFWSVGVPDHGETTPKTGLSATTPYDYFTAFISSSIQAVLGKWQSGIVLDGLNTAKALWAAYDDSVLKASATAEWDWLMTFSSNPANRTPANTAPKTLAEGTTGTYDPTMALATSLNITSKYEASQLYEWGTTGLLSEIQHDRAAYKLKLAKQELGKVRFRNDAGTFDDGKRDWTALRGRSGLSHQTSFTEDTAVGAVSRVWDMESAAQAGLAYRETPQAFGMKETGGVS